MVNTKLTGFAAVIFLLVAAGCGQKEPTSSPGKYISQAEAKIAIENASPQDGLAIPSQSVIIHWATRLESTGRVTYRKSTDKKWKTIAAGSNTMHSVKMGGLKPGDYLEYHIIIDLKNGSYKGPVRSINIALGGVAFAKKEYRFSIDRDYQQHCAIEISNNEDKPRVIKARVFNPHQDLIAGFVGEGSVDKIVDISSGERRMLELVVHAQDAARTEYSFVVNLETLGGKAMQDSARVLVKVKQVEFNIQTELGGIDPFTLAATLKIKNLGTRLTDFSIKPSKNLWGKVKIIPEVNHALLDTGGLLKTAILPQLQIGMRELAGDMVISAAGKKRLVPIKFVVPEGKRVFCATTQSIYQSSAVTHFCTNRKQVNVDLITPGNGPIEGYIGDEFGEYENNPEKTTEGLNNYVLEKGELDYRTIAKDAYDFFAGGIYGDKIENPNIYNLAGQIIFSTIIGWPADVRDIWFNAEKMIESGFAEHKVDFLLSLVGALPIAGDTLKIISENLNWGKYSDELAEGIRAGESGSRHAIETGIEQDIKKAIWPHRAPEVEEFPHIRGPDEALDVVKNEETVYSGGAKSWDDFSSAYKDKFEYRNAQDEQVAWREYQRANKNTDIMVIGNKYPTGDAAVAKEWPEHQILDIPDEEWSNAVNDAWIQGGIDRKTRFYLATPLNEKTLWNNQYNSPSIYAREIEQLKKAGYKQMGDYMMPPQ